MKRILVTASVLSVFVFQSCYFEEECEKKNIGHIKYTNESNYDCNVYIDGSFVKTVPANSTTDEGEISAGLHCFTATKIYVIGSNPDVLKDKESSIKPCSKNAFVFP